jgi:hypothetical protein
MLEVIADILARCGSSESVLPPTEVFNEGWMLRLVLDWLDRNRGVSHPLAFSPTARWYSEALLPSRFLPQMRGDPRSESFTHADGIIGDFEIASGLRGDAKLAVPMNQFIVVEAKLGSALSAGTKNAVTYDQAARNVACIAHMLSIQNIAPESAGELAFYVVAPAAQIQASVFGDLVTPESIEKKVRERVGAYAGAHDEWLSQWFLPTLANIKLGLLSWEEVLAKLPVTSDTANIREFYVACLKWNPLRGRDAI